MVVRLGALALAAALVVTLAVILGGPARPDEGRGAVAGNEVPAEVAALRGVPQQGIALGAADRP